jgi:hypothetical protein
VTKAEFLGRYRVSLSAWLQKGGRKTPRSSPRLIYLALDRNHIYARGDRGNDHIISDTLITNEIPVGIAQLEAARGNIDSEKPFGCNSTYLADAGSIERVQRNTREGSETHNKSRGTQTRCHFDFDFECVH